MIVVDIGNTSLHFAWFRKEEISRTFKISASSITRQKIEKILSKCGHKNIIVCSVVPRVLLLFKKLGKRVFVVGRDIKVPIQCLYDRKKVGADRLIGAYTAKKLFPEVRLVLDFGTAITLDFLSKAGAYQGGIILPGIGSTLRALSHCALLPKRVEFKKTKRLIPKNTNESINKGLEEGFSLMVNSLIREYKEKLKISPQNKVIITGGEASMVMHKLDFPYCYEPLLVLKGLGFLGHQITQ